MFLGAFILLGLISWRSVETANNAAEDARQDKESAEVQIAGLRRQIDCTTKILVDATRGQVGNSIFQDDLLLASFDGSDRNAIAQKLKATREGLVAISGAIEQADKECTK